MKWNTYLHPNQRHQIQKYWKTIDTKFTRKRGIPKRERTAQKMTYYDSLNEFKFCMIQEISKMYQRLENCNH